MTRANDYIRQLNLLPHEENGKYIPVRYAHESGERASSGSCLYYLGENEHSKFHIIDCDEYWVYNLGSDLELWIVFPDESFEIKILGTGKDASVIHFIPKGSLFAARHKQNSSDGTLLSLVTVPGFVEGSSCRLYTPEEVLKQYPFLESFWK